MKIAGMGMTEFMIIGLSIIIPLAIGLVCGFISKSQAAQKGYSEVGFFLMGFFLGIIGLIIALVIPARQNEALTNADGILKYKELLDQGVITQEEFEAKKNELMKTN